MTFKDYTENEKLAVIAVVKGIILAHGGFEEGEVDYVNEHITSENFPDYSEIFIKFEKIYKTEGSINEAFAEVEREEVKEQLIDLAINLAAASGIFDPEEVEIINHMCEIWSMEHKIEEAKGNQEE